MREEATVARKKAEGKRLPAMRKEATVAKKKGRGKTTAEGKLEGLSMCGNWGRGEEGEKREFGKERRESSKKKIEK
ncbi:hypothetical protein ACLB2K_004859 [Fragaria x ananassa]